MKQLCIIRHAKSDWSMHLPDVERPLNERGRRQAVELAKFLEENKLYPDKIITSKAVRTQQTATLIANEIAFPIQEIQAETSLYLATPDNLMQAVWSTPDEVEVLYLIAHNPGVTDFSYLLTGEYKTFKTSGMTHVVFPRLNHWEDVQEQTGILTTSYRVEG